MERDIYSAHHLLVQQGKEVTAEELRMQLKGTKENVRFLIPIFNDHNNRVKALVHQEYAPGTLTRYQTSLKHTLEFLQWKYNVNDIDINEIDHEFITSYDFYLRSVRKCANNSAVKYIKNFKKIIRICIANGWLKKDPFINYKARVKEVHREFLTQGELDSMVSKAKSISVFEGFFDFLSYQVINKNQEHELSNFLVLNSLSFFE